MRPFLRALALILCCLPFLAASNASAQESFNVKAEPLIAGRISTNACTDTTRDRKQQQVSVTTDKTVVGDLVAHPIPARDVVEINFALDHAATVVVDLLDAQGLVVWLSRRSTLTGEQRAIIHLEHLSAGMYTCRVMVDRSIKTITIPVVR